MGIIIKDINLVVRSNKSGVPSVVLDDEGNLVTDPPGKESLEQVRSGPVRRTGSPGHERPYREAGQQWTGPFDDWFARLVEKKLASMDNAGSVGGDLQSTAR